MANQDSKTPVQTLSIKAAEPESRLWALKESRLKVHVRDPLQFEKMCEAAMLLLNNDKIRACDEASIFGALYKAVTLKCRLEPEFGECYLIPRSVNVGTKENPNWVKTCVFQLGYKFWKAKALESGHIKNLQAHEVFTEDMFEVQYGTGGYLRHRPADETKGTTAWFYVYAPLTSGGELFEAINKFSAEKYRRKSESQWDTIGTGKNKTKKFREKPTDVWATDYGAMALRLPMKRLCAALPMTAAMETAMQEDGGVTYLQTTGTISRLSPKEVEAAAEPIEEPTSAPVPEAEKEKFEEWESAVGALSKAEEVLKLYAEFKPSDLYKNVQFVRLFFVQMAKVAETEEELSKLFHGAKEWQKTPELVKLLTDKKAEIEKAAKGDKK